VNVERTPTHRIPARPAGAPRTRRHRFLDVIERSRVPRGVVAILGVALVLALALASCGLLAGLDPVGRPGGRPVRPVSERAVVHPIAVRWGVDSLADPTALLVDGDDAFVVEPYAVSSRRVRDGAARWRVDVKDAEPWIAATTDTVLVAAVDGFEALRRDTGASRWRVTIQDPYDRGRGVGLVGSTGGPVAVLTTAHGGVVGVDAVTGTTRWSATVDGSPRGQVVGDDRTGLVAVEADRGDRVELHVLDAATGAERWSTALGRMTGLPLVDGPRLVLDTGGVDAGGTVVAFDLATGTRRWASPVAGSSEVGEGGIVDGDRIVLVDGLGTVTALDRTTGRRRWSTDLPGPVFHGRPIATGAVLVLRDITGVFHVLDRAGGRRRGAFRVSGVGVGWGAGPSGLVFARSQVTHHQVVGLPDAMLTMRTPLGVPPIPVPATDGIERDEPSARGAPAG
jgi:outer membrane protein assembly factor BamB